MTKEVRDAAALRTVYAVSIGQFTILIPRD